MVLTVSSPLNHSNYNWKYVLINWNSGIMDTNHLCIWQNTSNLHYGVMINQWHSLLCWVCEKPWLEILSSAEFTKLSLDFSVVAFVIIESSLLPEDEDLIHVTHEAFRSMTNVHQIVSRLFTRKVIRIKRLQQLNRYLKNEGSFVAASELFNYENAIVKMPLLTPMLITKLC